jgi:hypothetical protein
MNVKNELHELIDQLDDEAADVLEYAQWLGADEDEPLGPEELARVEAGEAECRRGAFVRLEHLKRRLDVQLSRAAERYLEVRCG